MDRISRLEQRFAQLVASLRGPRTPDLDPPAADLDPLPEHARTKRQPLDDGSEGARYNFTLSNQIKDFRAGGCKPIPTRALYNQSGLQCNITVYGRFLGNYLRDHHPDLATGPRRILEDNATVQRRCLFVAPSSLLAAQRQTVNESLARQIEIFRESFCTPVLAIDLCRDSTLDTTRHKYLRDLARYVADEHPDLELRMRRVINPQTHKPFATPWLVSRELPEDTTALHDERGRQFESQIKQTREILGNGNDVFTRDLWEQKRVDGTFPRYEQALKGHLAQFHPDLVIKGELIQEQQTDA